MEKVSIIVPCYNEEKAIPLFYDELKKNISAFPNSVEFEVIFVNDGSRDETLNILKDLSKKDSIVKYISFSRNFGKEAAIYAGLENSTGDYVTLMDADLQDPPSLLLEMYNILKNEDYDAVGTRRSTRKGEPIIRSMFAKLFYKIIDKITTFKMVDGARDYIFMKRIVTDAILSMKEYNRYTKGIFSFVGFKVKWLEYKNIERVAGDTKWSFWKLTKYALEGITAFSTFPLIFPAYLGVLFCLIFLALFIYILIKVFALTAAVSSTLVLITAMILLSGIHLIMLGIIGQYLSKTYLEIKKRPIYIIRETNIKE